MRRDRFLKAKIITAAFAAVLCFAAAASAFDAEGPAARIRTAEKAGSPTPIMTSEIALNDVPYAYGIQDAYVLVREKEGEVRAGYKAGLTSQSDMDRFGSKTPLSGVIFKSGRYIGSPIIAADTKGLTMVPEIGFRLDRAVTQKVSSVEELRGYVAAVFPAVELPVNNFSRSNISYLDIASTNLGAYKFITGRYMPIDSADLSNVSVTVDRDGKAYMKGNSSDVMGGAWNALLWLVNDVLSRGGKLSTGDIMLTGPMTQPAPATVGKYKADFGALGNITFQVYPLINE